MLESRRARDNTTVRVQRAPRRPIFFPTARAHRSVENACAILCVPQRREASRLLAVACVNFVLVDLGRSARPRSHRTLHGCGRPFGATPDALRDASWVWHVQPQPTCSDRSLEKGRRHAAPGCSAAHDGLEDDGGACGVHFASALDSCNLILSRCAAGRAIRPAHRRLPTSRANTRGYRATTRDPTLS